MATGLIAGQLNTQAINKDDPLKDITGYDAAKIDFNEGTDTTAGRLDEIVNSGSPLMQRAKTLGLQQANKRGLLNSSMAVGAAQSALYDAATPIASQDAQLSLEAKGANQSASNQALGFTADSKNQAAGQIYAGQQSLREITAQGDIQSRLQKERGDIDLQLQSADAATRERLLNRQAEIDRSLQQLQGEQQLSQIGARGEIETNLLREKGRIDLQLQTADAAAKEGLLNRQGEIDKDLTDIKYQRERELQSFVNDFQAQQAELERGFTADQSEQERNLQREQYVRAAANDLMIQISGQNATLTDSLAQIFASDMKDDSKQKMADYLIEASTNNMNNTMALADYEVRYDPETGKVEAIYQGSGDTTPSNGTPQSPAPYPPYPIYDPYNPIPYGGGLYSNIYNYYENQ